MRKLLVIAGLLAAVAAPLQAQQPGEPVTSGRGSVVFSPYVGYAWFGDLAKFSDATEFSLDASPMYGAQLGFSFTPNIALVGNFGYSKTNFELEHDDFPGDNRISDDLAMMFYDANLQFGLPFIANRMGSWIAPVAQVGVGGLKYTFDRDDVFGEGDTDIVFNFGIGGDFQITPVIGARVMVKDYITSMAWNNIRDVDFDDDVEDNVAHNWALTFGLKFGF
jgi:hypothetical protein